MKEKIIYSKWLALALRERGLKLIRTGINQNFPQYITYVFEDSEALRDAIQELTSK